MSDRRTGQCICGAVTFTAKLKDDAIQACHCQQCQRWTGGGPYFVVNVDEIDMKGEETILAYHASEWGERGACATCGATLYWKMQGKPISSVAVGLLDDQTGLTVREEIFTDRRAPWLPPFPGASQSTEAEEFAKLDAYLAGENS